MALVSQGLCAVGELERRGWLHSLPHWGGPRAAAALPRLAPSGPASRGGVETPFAASCFLYCILALCLPHGLPSTTPDQQLLEGWVISALALVPCPRLGTM